MESTRVVPTSNVSKRSGGLMSGFINLFIVIIGLVVLYYGFKFFYGTASDNSVVVESGKLIANQGNKIYTNQAPIYEGGEYSVSFWMYISGWKTKQGTRKHIMQIGGSNFATILIALGAFKNSLSVRVDTSPVAITDASGSHGAAGHDISGYNWGPIASGTSGIATTALSGGDIAAFFTPLSMDDGMAQTHPMCDIDEIDLQRWVHITVVLNGRTCDIYMDGKLNRSCVLPSFYRVDPTGQSVSVADRGGFDGYIGNIGTYNYALTPDAIYRTYMAGPTGGSTDPWSYLTGLFTRK